MKETDGARRSFPVVITAIVERSDRGVAGDPRDFRHGLIGLEVGPQAPPLELRTSVPGHPGPPGRIGVHFEHGLNTMSRNLGVPNLGRRQAWGS